MANKANTVDFDLALPIAMLLLFVRNCEPGVLEDLRELVADLPRELLASFLA